MAFPDAVTEGINTPFGGDVKKTTTVLWTCPIPWGRSLAAGPNLELKTNHEDATSGGLRCFAQ